MFSGHGHQEGSSKWNRSEYALDENICFHPAPTYLWPCLGHERHVARNTVFHSEGHTLHTTTKPHSSWEKEGRERGLFLIKRACGLLPLSWYSQYRDPPISPQLESHSARPLLHYLKQASLSPPCFYHPVSSLGFYLFPFLVGWRFPFIQDIKEGFKFGVGWMFFKEYSGDGLDYILQDTLLMAYFHWSVIPHQ